MLRIAHACLVAFSIRAGVVTFAPWRFRGGTRPFAIGPDAFTPGGRPGRVGFAASPVGFAGSLRTAGRLRAIRIRSQGIGFAPKAALAASFGFAARFHLATGLRLEPGSGVTLDLALAASFGFAARISLATGLDGPGSFALRPHAVPWHQQPEALTLDSQELAQFAQALALQPQEFALLQQAVGGGFRPLALETTGIIGKRRRVEFGTRRKQIAPRERTEFRPARPPIELVWPAGRALHARVAAHRRRAGSQAGTIRRHRTALGVLLHPWWPAAAPSGRGTKARTAAAGPGLRRRNAPRFIAAGTVELPWRRALLVAGVAWVLGRRGCVRATRLRVSLFPRRRPATGIVRVAWSTLPESQRCKRHR
ncbi:MAG: hypothetical protein ACHRHE_02375 [Tepidisphaerales bacterium]